MPNPATMTDDELIAEWEAVAVNCGEEESDRCRALAEEMQARDLSF